MTTRRDFLKRLTLTSAGLLVADDALQLLADMAKPRKLYVPGADFGPRWRVTEGSWGPTYELWNFELRDWFAILPDGRVVGSGVVTGVEPETLTITYRPA